jgi:hypothetical protein
MHTYCSSKPEDAAPRSTENKYELQKGNKKYLEYNMGVPGNYHRA